MSPFAARVPLHLRPSFLLVLLALPLAVMAVSLGRRPRARGAMPQEAYVWQRSWTASVREAVEASGERGRGGERGAGLAGLVVLGASVSFAAGEPVVTEVAFDAGALRASGQPIGLALRIGPYRGPIEARGRVFERLRAAAGGMIERARAAQIPVTELQIDFDCAASRLEDYRAWVEGMRAASGGAAVTITALPSWLGQRAFAPLAEATDGFVLQVHSAERPEDPRAALALCDPSRARRAVEAAGRLGKSFRVALPTYSYALSLDGEGRLLGLSAEEPPRGFADEASRRLLRADPAAMAGLVRSLTADRPASLAGILWYRLPVAGDRYNWQPSTLAAVMEGRAPAAALRAELHSPEPGLWEVQLVNRGDEDAPLATEVSLRWASGSLVGSDALAGFEAREEGRALRLEGKAEGRVVAAGQRLPIGWLRISDASEVTVDDRAIVR